MQNKVTVMVPLKWWKSLNIREKPQRIKIEWRKKIGAD
jgi:hypothetical protein